MDDAEDDVELLIDDVFLWMCLEARPAPRPRFNQVFAVPPGEFSQATIDEMWTRGWVKKGNDPCLVQITSAGLTAMRRRGMAPGTS